MPNYEVTLIAYTTIAVEDATDEQDAREIAEGEVDTFDWNIDEVKIIDAGEAWETIKRCSNHTALS